MNIMYEKGESQVLNIPKDGRGVGGEGRGTGVRGKRGEAGVGEVQDLGAAQGGHLRRRVAVTPGGSAARALAGRRRRCPRSGAWSW